MYRRLALPIALLALVTFSCLNSVSGDAQEKVTVDVYYESLCPDSIYFITKELAPAYNAGLKDYLKVNLIPFGKASWYERNNKTSFRCQHGPSECKGNRAQACALYEIAETLSIDDQQQKMVDIVNCVMSRDDPSISVPECARSNHISDESVQNIESCSSSKFGDELLVAEGNKTKDFESPIKFVPTIVINGTKRQEAFRNFSGVVCQYISSSEKLSACQ